MSLQLLADEIQHGLIQQDALNQIPEIINSYGRSYTGLLIFVVCICLILAAYQILKANDLYGPLLLGLSTIFIPTGLILYTAGFYSIRFGVEASLYKELVELESDFREIVRLSDQLEENFSLELKEFVENGKAQLPHIPQESKDELNAWFLKWSQISGVRAVLSNGSHIINLTSEQLHENSLILLPTLQSIVRLKVREAEEDSSNSIYQTLSMAKDMLRDSFHGIQFLDLFLNNPNRLFQASSLRLFESSKDVKAFWTYIDLKAHGFWFMIGLITEERTDASIRSQLLGFSSRLANRHYRLPAKTFFIDSSEHKDFFAKKLPNKFVSLSLNGVKVYGLKPILGLINDDYLLIEIDANSLIQTQREIENNLFLFCLILIIVPVPLSLLMGYGLGKPLRQIHHAIEELIKEKQPRPLQRTGRDQPSELAQLFNQFLKERIHSLATEQFYSTTMQEINSWWTKHQTPKSEVLKNLLANPSAPVEAIKIEGDMLKYASELLSQLSQATILYIDSNSLIYAKSSDITVELSLPLDCKTTKIMVCITTPVSGFSLHLMEQKS